MQLLRVVPAACLAERPAETPAHFVGVVIPSMEGDRDLNKDLTVLADPAERATIESAAIHWAEVRQCYFCFLVY